MSCQHYQKELEAAGSGLNPADGAQFEAHLFSCSACRAELERWKLVYAAIDEGLSRRVNEDLPPGFVTRVRARVNANRDVASSHRWLDWAAVGAAAAMLMGLVLTLGLRRERQHSTVGQTMRQDAPRPKERLGARKEEPTAPAVSPAKSLVRGARTAPRRLQVAGGKSASAPKVLVPADQQQIVTRLLEGLRVGEVKGEVLLAIAGDQNQELTIAPLSIQPIQLKPLEDGQAVPERSSQ